MAQGEAEARRGRPLTTRARLERVRERGLDVLAGCIGLEAQRGVRELVRFVDDELADEAEERARFGAHLLAEFRGGPEGYET